MEKKILVITSSLAEQVQLLLLLTAAGYTPTCCESLPSALTALESSTFDAIITDPIIIDTPPQKMTAVEFVSLVQKTPNPTTPILVMGDVISLQYIMNTLRSGIARFIPKPFTPTEFIETVSAELCVAEHQHPQKTIISNR
ncbi:response regulator [Halodesulfovibrio aestuarii]|uniref:response regulator n=1 Tax=Halodesulfovibrio aestuarii TaxID=126333 RepID=UPI0003F90EB3